MTLSKSNIKNKVGTVTDWGMSEKEPKIDDIEILDYEDQYTYMEMINFQYALIGSEAVKRLCNSPENIIDAAKSLHFINSTKNWCRVEVDSRWFEFSDWYNGGILTWQEKERCFQWLAQKVEARNYLINRKKTVAV